MLSERGVQLFARSAAAVFLVLFLATRWLAEDGLDPNDNPLAPDLAQFYVAGELVLEGQAARLYDRAYVWERINATLGVDDGTGTAFFYPPYVAPLCVPLAMLPYAVTAWTYLGLSLALGLGLGWWIASTLLREAGGGEHWHGEAVNACWLFVASVPFWRCVLFGQNGLIWLLVAWAAFLLARRERWFAAGLVLAFGFCKPQVFLGLFVWMALAGGWRARGGLALGGGVLAALGSFMGWTLWGQWWLSLGGHQDAPGSEARMHDLPHVLAPWMGEAGWASPVGLLGIGLLLVVWAGVAWTVLGVARRMGVERPWPLERLDGPAAVSLAALVTAFAVAGPRTYQYDLLVFFPLLMGWWASGRCQGQAPASLMLLVVLAFYLSDLLAWMGIPILSVLGFCFLVAMCIKIRRST
ncbi:MAG: glycosyltransferase family 87 protein [Verrucomicrobiota bacterium]